MTTQLEPDLQEPFDAWKAQPSPQTTGRLLRQLQPSIDKGLRMYAGQDVGPTTRSHAKRLALKSLNTYDPTQARLGTHVINHLQGLRRVVRREQQIIRTPDRVAADQAYVYRMTQELEERLGREPTDLEIADHSGISVRRLAKLRRHLQPLAEGSFESPETLNAVPLRPEDRERRLMQLVYEDLDPRDQKILEWSLALHGKPRLDNRDIAVKLGVSPGAVSQRKAAIQSKIDALQSYQGL